MCVPIFLYSGTSFYMLRHLLSDCFCSTFQTEYKYCYDLVLHYVLHYLHKEEDGAGANETVPA